MSLGSIALIASRISGQTGVSSELLKGQEEHTLFLDFNQVNHGGSDNGKAER